jgi:hypothetical protein
MDAEGHSILFGKLDAAATVGVKHPNPTDAVVSIMVSAEHYNVSSLPF